MPQRRPTSHSRFRCPGRSSSSSPSFAQFYREQLAENVKMGQAQARAQGKWTNRPPTGYDLGPEGILVPNADAATIVRVFELRAAGESQTEVETRTGVKHSTGVQILRNRAYLGETSHRGDWLPGIHEPIISQQLWDRAHKGRQPGVRRGKDLLSGFVRCECGAKRSIDQNGKGQRQYRCKHRGKSCGLPARSNKGLERAAVHALGLLRDPELQDAITPGSADALEALRTEQKKLLQVFYNGHIDEQLFAAEQARIRQEIENHAHDVETTAAEAAKSVDLGARFEEVLVVLEQLNIEDLWPYATDAEKRMLLAELLLYVEVGSERLTVHLNGVPAIGIAFGEVGLKDSGLGGVEGANRWTFTGCDHRPSSLTAELSTPTLRSFPRTQQCPRMLKLQSRARPMHLAPHLERSVRSSRSRLCTQTRTAPSQAEGHRSCGRG